MSDDKWWSKNTSIGWPQGETAEEYKCASFATETVKEYKYQIVTETVERNTSKQVSAKETALWNMCKYLIFFSFLKQSECRETETRKWNEGILRL